MNELFSKWINPKAVEIEKLKHSFSKAKPFPHVLIKNVLQAEKFVALKNAVSKEKFMEKECDLFHFLQTDELKFSKNKVIQEWYELFGSKEFVSLIAQCSNVTLAPKVMDTFAAVYAPTHFLLCHDDRLQKRKVAFILYLEPSTQGGALELFTKKNGHPARPVKKVMPLENSLMIFEVSGSSFHAVEEVRKGNRMSIGGWFH